MQLPGVTGFMLWGGIFAVIFWIIQRLLDTAGGTQKRFDSLVGIFTCVALAAVVVTVLGTTGWAMILWRINGFWPWMLTIAGIVLAAVVFLAMLGLTQLVDSPCGSEVVVIGVAGIVTGVFIAVSGIFWESLWWLAGQVSAILHF